MGDNHDSAPEVSHTERDSATVGAAVDARRRRFCVTWALFLLPLFLGAVAIAGSATHLRFLLFPPLAAIGFALFLEPYHQRTSLRSVVAGPVAGALIGVAAGAWLPAGPLRVAAVTALSIIALYLLRAELTPALAVALLTLLVGASGVAYIISIMLSSLALWGLFLLWRRTVYARAYPPAPAPAAVTSKPCMWTRLRRAWQLDQLDTSDQSTLATDLEVALKPLPRERFIGNCACAVRQRFVAKSPICAAGCAVSGKCARVAIQQCVVIFMAWYGVARHSPHTITGHTRSNGYDGAGGSWGGSAGSRPAER